MSAHRPSLPSEPWDWRRSLAVGLASLLAALLTVWLDNTMPATADTDLDLVGVWLALIGVWSVISGLAWFLELGINRLWPKE